MTRVYLMRTNAADLSAAAWRLLEYIVGPLPETAKSPHGKPFFPDKPELAFNLSHTAGAVVCAISDHPCGIDVEPVNRLVNRKIAGRFFTSREIAFATDSRRFLEVWTRKEALIKRDGGILRPMREIETIGHPQIKTQVQSRYIVSFCGKNPQFAIVEVEQKRVL